MTLRSILTFVCFFFAVSGAAFAQSATPAPKATTAPNPQASAAPKASPVASPTSSATKPTALAAAAAMSGSVRTTSSGLVAKNLSNYRSNDLVSSGGSFQYSVPIALPPGTGGVAPSLSIDYNSANGNDLLGVGFVLSGLSKFERDPSYPINYTGSDKYMLDGNKLFFRSSDKTFHFEKESFDQIQVFSAASPGTPQSDAMASDSFWVVTKKDGTVFTYGNTTDSRIEGFNKGTAARVWALNKVTSTLGNAYTVSYTEDAYNGTYYPAKIIYTLNAANALTTTKTVTFGYETRTDATEYYQPAKVKMTQRLASISVYVGTDTAGLGGSLLRKYVLSYNYGPQSLSSQLIKIQEFGSDGTSSLPPTLFSYSGFNTDLYTTLASSSSSGLFGTNCSSAVPYDLNGDGFTDYLLSDGSNSYAYRNEKNNTFQLVATFSSLAGISIGGLIGPFDYNGDGIDDLVLYNSSTSELAVVRGNGDGYYTQVYKSSMRTVSGNGSANFSTIPMDYNADGKCDLLLTSDLGPVFLLRSAGDGSFSKETVSGDISSSSSNQRFGSLDANADGYPDVYRYSVDGNGLSNSILVTYGNGSGGFYGYTSFGVYNGGIAQILPFDYNGDGRQDLLIRYAPVPKSQGYWSYGRWVVAQSTGDNAFTVRVDTNMLNGINLDTTNVSFQVLDCNGDGRADFLYSGQYQNATVMKSVVDHSFNVFYSNSTGNQSPGVNAVTGDVDADGCMDILVYSTSYSIGQTGYSGQYWIGSPNCRVPSLLAQITLPSGGTISTTYISAPKSTGAVTPSFNTFPNVAQTSTRQIVSSIQINDSNGTVIQTNYSYSNGKIRKGTKNEVRDLGFSTVTALDVATNVKTITTYDQNFPYQGLPTSVLIQDSTGTKWVETSTTYSKTDTVGVASSFLYPTQQIVKKYDGQATIQAYFRKDYVSYDVYGNLTQSVDYGEVNADLSDKDPKDNVEANAVYAQSATTKAVRLITQNVQTYDASGTKDVSSKSEIYYDGNSTLGAIGAGLATKTVSWIDATTTATTTMNYDVWGNVMNVQDARVNAGEYGGNTVTTTYDPSYRNLPLTQTNALGQTTTYTYDSLTRPQTATDPNENVSTSVYDVFSRVVKAYDSIDSLAQPTASSDYFLVGTKWYTRSKAKTSGSATVDSYTYTDGLGRTIQTKKQAVGGWITQDYYWDASGRNYQISVPYLTTTNPTASTTDPFPFVTRDSTQKQTVLSFDKLDRVVKTTNPDTTFATVTYLGNTTTNVDENDHVTQVITSPNTVAYLTFTGTSANKTLYSTTTTKTYRGQVQIVDNSGNTITSTVDYLGRRIGYNDPNMGTWAYSYDKNGNLTGQTDAKSQTISYTYDKLNRLTGKSATDTTVNATYTYDLNTNGIGRLSSVTYNRGSDTNLYDVRGRVTSTTRTLDGIAKTESFTYDSADRKVTETLPDGEVVTSTYGADGNLTALAGTNNYVTGITYTALNKVKTLSYGNGITTTYNYYDDATTDPTTGLHHSYRLRQILAGGGNAVMNLSYSYDKGDNVKSRTDGNNSNNSEAFAYDELNRLISANATIYGNLVFEYDALNRLTKKDGLNYTYYASKPNQVQTYGSYGYTYDENGNTLSKSGVRTLTYDAENRTTSMSDGGTMSYGAGRNRTIKELGTKKTLYYFENYIEEYTSGSLSNTTKFYSANNIAVAQRTTAQGLYYVHSDHLGSSTKLTDTAGVVVRSQIYKPYGETAIVTGAGDTVRQYTGQIKEENNLYYYNARYYDPELARFVQADPAAASVADAVKISIADQLNAYMYCQNNPIKYNDPTGYRPRNSSGRSKSSSSTSTTSTPSSVPSNIQNSIANGNNRRANAPSPPSTPPAPPSTNVPANVQSNIAAGNNAGTNAQSTTAAPPTLSSWPTTSRDVSSPWGPRSEPVPGAGNFHSGIDVSVNSGTPTYSPGNGTVSQVANHPSYGNTVVVSVDNGLTTASMHLSTVSVTVGENVTSGQQIGTTGETGSLSSGPHLHFSVWADPSLVPNFTTGAMMVPTNTINPQGVLP